MLRMVPFPVPGRNDGKGRPALAGRPPSQRGLRGPLSVALARIGVAGGPADRRIAGGRAHEAGAAPFADLAAEALRIAGRGEARDRDPVEGAAVNVDGR